VKKDKAEMQRRLEEAEATMKELDAELEFEHSKFHDDI
jgi:hypothetical protein